MTRQKFDCYFYKNGANNKFYSNQLIRLKSNQKVPDSNFFNNSGVTNFQSRAPSGFENCPSAGGIPEHELIDI
jgi:hypothetical protein